MPPELLKGEIKRLLTGEKDYRKLNEKALDKFLDKKLGELEISKELENKNKNDLLVSYDLIVYILVLRYI